MMNQTYIIENLITNNSNDKKSKLKAKLGKLRERTQLLLQNHSWKKFFENSNTMISNEQQQQQQSINNIYLVSSSTENSGENIFRRNNEINNECDDQKASILVVKQSFLNKDTSNCNNNLLFTPIENYFLTSNTQLNNIFDETPIIREDKRSM